MKHLLYWSLILIFSINSYVGKAQTINKSNPVVPDDIADPSMVIFNNTYYLYGTTDIGKGLAKMGPPVVWKSKDFVNWSFEGTILPSIDFNKEYTYTDAKGAAKTGYFRFWAPGKALYKNGRYYLSLMAMHEPMPY